MNAFLHVVERHKDLADLGIKAVGMGATLIGAIWVAWKYFADRTQARSTTELDLKREAYFEFFSAVPLQLAALGKFYNDRDPIALPPEAFKALHRLHLLASHDALECIIRRNTMYHEGVLKLTALKRTAMQLESIVDAGNQQMFESNLKAWETFREQFRKLVAELSANYRELLVFARREIGLKGGTDEIVAALEREAKVALETFAQL